MAKETYAQKNKGARYVVVVDGYANGGKVYRIWDREKKKNYGTKKYTNKRKAQDDIDEM